MPSGCDEYPTTGEEMKAFWHAMGNLQKEIQTLRAEQLHANERLLLGLSNLQILIEAPPEPPLRPISSGSLKSQTTHVDAPKQLQSASSNRRSRPSLNAPNGSASVPSKKSHQSQPIPDLVDLEKTWLRKSAIMPVGAVAPKMPPSKVQPELHPVLQADPSAPKSSAALSRRGSDLKILARDSQSRILTPRSKEFARNLFQENIGVGLWLNWSNFSSLVIAILILMYLVSTVVLQVREHQPGNYYATFDLLMYSGVAILLLQRVRRLLRSEELNAALQKLEEFVDNCGHGLDWPSVSKKWWRRSLALWLLVLLAFVVEQVLEVWKTVDTARDESFDASLQIFKAFTSSLLFAFSSAVVMNGTYCIFTLMLGLGKTLDCWSADLMEDRNFISGIDSWNPLQALLKSIGREVAPSFMALCTFGYAGFLAAVVGSVSLLLDPNLDASTLALYESSLLPLIYLFVLSAGLLASGASVSEKCQQIPAFVNQLSCQGSEEPDTDRQYLVRYISDSRAGFILYGVTLSQTALLKQAHVFFALCTGVAGILMRRFL